MSEEFARAATAYCAWIESVKADTPIENRLVTTRELLLELYAAGTQLPLDPESGLSLEVPRSQPSGWPGFDEHDAYWETFDPAQDTIVGASLTDDVMDIYADVARGLALWNQDHRVEAVWEWRFHFDIHWGDHAVDALRVLHRAIRRVRDHA
jgi:hypothetical protein